MPDPITVLHLRASNFVGGPEKQILEHMLSINRQRFRPILCCFKENGQNDPMLAHAQQLSIRCRTINSRSAFDLGTIVRLRRVLVQENVDLLCSHGYKPSVIGRIAGWMSHIPCIAISRGWTAESRRIRLFEKMDKLFLHFSDHVVAVSEGQREKIVALGVKPGKISVIHNGINIENIPAVRGNVLRDSLALPDDSVVIASAGRLSPEKNQAAMVEAARLVVRENRNAFFVIFGEGFLRSDLEKQIDNAGLKGRFFLPGFREDLQSLLKEIDIFMLPSITEGLPNVVLEAFAVKKPVIATAVGGTPEVVTHGVSGFLTTPAAVGEMAEYIIRLVRDPALRVIMGESGYRDVQKNFDFEQQTRKYEELYNTIYNHRHAGAQ